MESGAPVGVCQRGRPVHGRQSREVLARRLPARRGPVRALRVMARLIDVQGRARSGCRRSQKHRTRHGRRHPPPRGNRPTGSPPDEARRHRSRLSLAVGRPEGRGALAWTPLRLSPRDRCGRQRRLGRPSAAIPLGLAVCALKMPGVPRLEIVGDRGMLRPIGAGGEVAERLWDWPRHIPGHPSQRSPIATAIAGETNGGATVYVAWG